MTFFLNSPWHFFFLLAGLFIFCIIAWRRLDLALGLVLFLAPTYIFKFSFLGLPLTLLEVLILAVLFVWLIKKIIVRSFYLKLSNFRENQEFWLATIMILTGALVSSLLSPDIRTGVGIFKAWILEPAIFVFLLFDTIRTSRQSKKILSFLFFSGIVQAFIGLGYWLTGHLTYDGRLAAFYLSPNHLAMALAPCFLIGLGMGFGPLNKFFKLLLFALCALLLFVLYLTFSYAAWLAILAALIVSLFLLGRARIFNYKKLLGICFILFVFSLMFFSLQMGSDKLNNLLHSDRSSWESRLIVWRVALRIGKDNWFFGVGPGLFQKYYLAYQRYYLPYLEWAVPQPQNIFLAFWLQTGLVGLLGFVWLVVGFFLKTLGNFFKTKQPLALVLAAVMIYFLVHGFFDTPFWKNDLSLIFLVIAALGYRAGRLRDW